MGVNNNEEEQKGRKPILGEKEKLGEDLFWSCAELKGSQDTWLRIPGDGELMHAHETDREMRGEGDAHPEKLLPAHLHVHDVQMHMGEGEQKHTPAHSRSV